MAFPRPTFEAIEQKIVSSILSSQLPGVGQGLLRFGVFRVEARAMAEVLNEMYAYLDYIATQVTPYTASGEYLEAWAAIKGIIKTPAAFATGKAAVQFTGSPGAVIPIGTQILRIDGFKYVTTADMTIGGSGLVTVDVIATTTGPGGNVDAGIAMTLSSTVAGVTTTGVTIAAITGGADIEANDAFRTRTLLRYQKPAQGGSETDYENWVLEVTGVTRVWVDAINNPVPGTVRVYPMLDISETNNSGFPVGTNGVSTEDTRWPEKATGDQGRIAEHLEPLRNVTDMLYVASPTPQPIDFTFSLLSPNTQANQQAIATALTNLFVAVGSPVGTDAERTITQSQIVQAILGVGNVQFNLSNPAGSVTTDYGSLPIVGRITFPVN